MSAAERAGLAAFAAGALLLAAAALAWADVAPGGWRLRSVFEPDWRRAARDTALHACERLARFEREDPGVPAGAVAFVGSSTIERFDLAAHFPGAACVNRGISNAGARLLASVAERLLPPAPPAGIVLYAGVVDWYAAVRDERAAAAAVAELVDALRARAPGARMLVLGPLPARDLGEREAADLARFEAALAELAGSRAGTDFLPLARPPLSSPEGRLAEEMSCDRLHLGREGYRVLAGWLRERGGTVGERLGP
jgi:lysophospholipase L1-like esterase